MNTNDWPSVAKMYKDRKKIRRDGARRGLSDEIKDGKRPEIPIKEMSKTIRVKKVPWIKRVLKKIFFIPDKKPKTPQN